MQFEAYQIFQKNRFSQQLSNLPIGVPSLEEEKGSKIPNIINLAPTGIRKSARLANKPRQKYGLFTKFSLAVIGSCYGAKKFHIFITIANQHIQEINRHFDGTLNNFGPMVFAENQ